MFDISRTVSDWAIHGLKWVHSPPFNHPNHRAAPTHVEDILSSGFDLMRMMEYPKTSKALKYSAVGADLEVVEFDVPAVKANELLIKVHAASINPADTQLWRSGLIGAVAGQRGMGCDFSGIVAAVGSNVNGWTPGDEIFGLFMHLVSYYF